MFFFCAMEFKRMNRKEKTTCNYEAFNGQALIYLAVCWSVCTRWALSKQNEQNCAFCNPFCYLRLICTHESLEKYHFRSVHFFFLSSVERTVQRIKTSVFTRRDTQYTKEYKSENYKIERRKKRVNYSNWISNFEKLLFGTNDSFETSSSSTLTKKTKKLNFKTIYLNYFRIISRFRLHRQWT